MLAKLRSLGIDQMSIDERIDLVQEIWDSIAAESSQSTLTDAQRRELERRIADDDANPNDLVSWDEVKAKVLAR